MESQLFIYQESTSLVKPAVIPLAVKKAPMKREIVFRPELKTWQSAVRDGLLEAVPTMGLV